MTGPRLISTARLAAEFGVAPKTLTGWLAKYPTLAACHDGKGYWYMVAARAEIRRLSPAAPKLKRGRK